MFLWQLDKNSWLGFLIKGYILILAEQLPEAAAGQATAMQPGNRVQM